MNRSVQAPQVYRGKRALDVTGAALCIILCSPILLGAAVVVRLSSPGPVIFRARRLGQFGSEFDALKFRTMRAGPIGPRVTTATDGRITKAGRFLRATKVDELPQLFNVLEGDMSLVGPRPEDPLLAANYSIDDAQILDWKPGITSPASLEFRHEEQILAGADDLEVAYREIMKAKIDIDREYFLAATLRSDIRVLFETVAAILRPHHEEHRFAERQTNVQSQG